MHIVRKIRPSIAVADGSGDWRDASACRTAEPELFFPRETALGKTRDAKRLCAACPVVQQCLTWALDHNEAAGIWGGLDERERRLMKRAQARRAARERTAA